MEAYRGRDSVPNRPFFKGWGPNSSALTHVLRLSDFTPLLYFGAKIAPILQHYISPLHP